MKHIDLDKLFKNKLEHRTYEFDEKAWLQAEALLNKQKRKRRGFWIWLLGASLLVLFSIGLFLMISTKTSESETKIKYIAHANKKEVAPINQVHSNDVMTDVSENVSALISEEMKWERNIKKSTALIQSSPTTTIVKSVFPIEASQHLTTKDKLVSTDLQRLSFNSLEVMPSIPMSFSDVDRSTVILNLNVDIASIAKERPLESDATKLFLLSAGVGKSHQHVQAGLAFLRPLSEKWEWQSGIHYHWVRTNDLPTHRGNLASYHALQRVFYKSTIEADQFHYAGLSTILHFAINKRHALNIGVQWDRLFLTRGTIREEGILSRAVWIVETGLNRNHFALTTGYRVSLKSNCYAHAEYLWNLTDVYTDELLSKKLHHIRIGLGLRF